MASRSSSLTVITPCSRPENLVTIPGAGISGELDEYCADGLSFVYNYLASQPTARAPSSQRRVV